MHGLNDARVAGVGAGGQKYPKIAMPEEHRDRLGAAGRAQCRSYLPSNAAVYYRIEVGIIRKHTNCQNNVMA